MRVPILFAGFRRYIHNLSGAKYDAMFGVEMIVTIVTVSTAQLQGRLVLCLMASLSFDRQTRCGSISWTITIVIYFFL